MYLLSILRYNVSMYAIVNIDTMCVYVCMYVCVCVCVCVLCIPIWYNIRVAVL